LPNQLFVEDNQPNEEFLVKSDQGNFEQMLMVDNWDKKLLEFFL